MATTANLTGLSQLKSDWNNMFTSNSSLVPKAGDSTKWAGGILSRQADGTLGYVNDTNGHYSTAINKDTDPLSIASADPTVGHQFAKQYGINVNNSGTQSVTPQWFGQAAGMLGENFNSPDKTFNGLYHDATQGGKVMMKTPDGPMDIPTYMQSNYYKAATDGSVYDQNAWNNAGSSAATSPSGAAASGLINASGTPSTNAVQATGASSSAAPLVTSPASNGSSTSMQNGVAVANQTQRTIDPNLETVQGQISSIINQNSPVMQLAKSQALQQANDRGLINSSIAVGAGQNAVINAATPIATADANVYGNAANLNVNTANQFAATNAAAQNTKSQFDITQANTKSQFDITQANDMAKANLSSQTQITLQNLGDASKLALTKINNDNAQLIDSNKSAGLVYQQAMQEISTIERNTDMDAANKQAAIDHQISMLKSSLGIYQLNLGDTLSSFDTPTPAAAATAGATTSNFDDAGQANGTSPAGTNLATTSGTSSRTPGMTEDSITTPTGASFVLGNLANGMKGLYDKAGILSVIIPGAIYAKGFATVMNWINNYTPGQENMFNASDYSSNSVANNYQSNPSVGPGSGETSSDSGSYNRSTGTYTSSNGYSY